MTRQDQPLLSTTSSLYELSQVRVDDFSKIGLLRLINRERRSYFPSRQKAKKNLSYWDETLEALALHTTIISGMKGDHFLFFAAMAIQLSTQVINSQ